MFNGKQSGTPAQEEHLLVEHDAYIVALARNKVPRRPLYTDNRQDDIEDLAQKIRIKLWHISQRQQILATRAYIRRIATTVSIDTARELKSVVPLRVSEDGELYQGNLLFRVTGEAQDPADVIEQQERFQECMEWLVAGVLELPSCQQRALLCSLKKREEDFHLFFGVLKRRGLDIESLTWPDDKKEQQSLRTSLTIARRKMRVWHKRRASS